MTAFIKNKVDSFLTSTSIHDMFTMHSRASQWGSHEFAIWNFRTIWLISYKLCGIFGPRVLSLIFVAHNQQNIVNEIFLIAFQREWIFIQWRLMLSKNSTLISLAYHEIMISVKNPKWIKKVIYKLFFKNQNLF